jgi:hypothetical protein
MDLLRISDFCRKFKLPQHRFSRYKYAFALEHVDGYCKPWVKVNKYNLDMVKEILSHTGTRKKKDRLSLEQFCVKYGLTSHHFTRVYNRLQLDEVEGKTLLIDSKHNYALLKYGRLIRKKS